MPKVIVYERSTWSRSIEVSEEELEQLVGERSAEWEPAQGDLLGQLADELDVGDSDAIERKFERVEG